jgi:hypothetical protein
MGDIFRSSGTLSQAQYDALMSSQFRFQLGDNYAAGAYYELAEASINHFAGGAYAGYFTGTDVPIAGQPVKMLSGRLAVVYVDPDGKAGYLISNLTGGTDPATGQFGMGASGLYPIEMVSNAGIAAQSLYSNYQTTTWPSPGVLTSNGDFGSDSYIGVTAFSTEIGRISTQPQWGVWKSDMRGTYVGSGDSWNLYVEQPFNNYTALVGAYTMGTQWSSNVVTGITVGFGADVTDQPKTWISVGETQGYFDAALRTWQAITTGPAIETPLFLAMAADPAGRTKLQQLNIPSVEVGSMNLTGSGNNFTSLSMTDVKFFAPSSGAMPQLWATGNVTGTYTAPPNLAQSIAIYGPLGPGNMPAADISFKSWNVGPSGGSWLARVDGSGGFNGSTQFIGAAAGSGAKASGGGTITGTAAGIAR